MHDDNLHLRSVLRTNAPEPISKEDDSGLPSLRAGEYQAFSRPSNRPIYAIHFVDSKGDVRSYQYVHLDSDSRFTSERITLRFLGMEPTVVEISGRNLWKLYDYLHQQRLCWILTSSRDWATSGDSIVNNVQFTLTNHHNGGDR